MPEDQDISISPEPPPVDDLSGICSLDNRANRSSDIDSIVLSSFSYAETRGHLSFYRPDKASLALYNFWLRPLFALKGLDLQDLGCPRNEDPLSNSNLAWVCNVIDFSNFLHVNSVSLTDPPEGLVFFDCMINSLGGGGFVYI